jgi:hypothetical protein
VLVARYRPTGLTVDHDRSRLLDMLTHPPPLLTLVALAEWERSDYQSRTLLQGWHPRTGI